jgi:hypothetical protein
MARALEAQGHTVTPFTWSAMPGFSLLRALGPVERVGRKAQNRFLAGPHFAAMNQALVELVGAQRPDVLFTYGGSHVMARTIEAIRRISPATTTVLYCNDDPFSSGHPWYRWRHVRQAVPLYDLVLAYRPANLQEFLDHGARAVDLMPPWYVEDRHRIVPLTKDDESRYRCDVVFIGHFEDDGRLEALEAVAGAGIDLRMFGHGEQWNARLSRSRLLRRFVPLAPLWDAEYNKAICGARIALAFLSRLNRDTYTRRCFEIPAAGTMLLSQRTAELEQLFTPGIDADFFASPDELIAQLRRYLAEPLRLAAVARAGHERVRKDGHGLSDRMRWLASRLQHVPANAHQ